jgi:site-specific recombinase XerD
MAAAATLDPPFMPPLGRIIPIREVIDKKLYTAYDYAKQLPLKDVELPPDFLDYLGDLKTATARGKPATKLTLHAAREDLARFAYFMPTPPKKLTSKDIRTWIVKARKHGFSSSTLGTTLNRINAFYLYRFRIDDFYPCPYCGHTEHEEIVFNAKVKMYRCRKCTKNLNPVASVPIPAIEERNDPILTLDEITMCINLIPFLVRPSHVLLYEGLIRLLLETAVRINKEALTLGLDPDVPNYIDLENCEVVLREVKGNQRTLQTRPISFTTRDVILQHAYNLKQRGKDPMTRVFPIAHGGIWKLFKALQVNAGIKKRIYPHLTRATFATTFWEMYRSEKALKAAGGWSSDAFKRYLRISDAKILEMSREYVRDRYQAKEILEVEP